jgi:molybdate transport system ATP-binding protein
VARLVGLNLLAGVATDRRVLLPSGGWVELAHPASGGVYVAFRPSAVSVFTSRPEGSPRNVWRGRIGTIEPNGDGVRLELTDVPDRSSSILAQVTQAAVAELGLQPGGEVWAAVKASEVEVYSRDVGH